MKMRRRYVPGSKRWKVSLGFTPLFALILSGIGSTLFLSAPLTGSRDIGENRQTRERAFELEDSERGENRRSERTGDRESASIAQVNQSVSSLPAPSLDDARVREGEMKTASPYRVLSSVGVNGKLLTIDRTQLFRTDWMNSVIEADPHLVLDNSKNVRGVGFNNISPSGIFHAIGIEKGDVVTAINGKSLTRPLQIPALIMAGMTSPSMELAIERNGRTTKLELRTRTLGERIDEAEVAKLVNQSKVVNKVVSGITSLESESASPGAPTTQEVERELIEIRNKLDSMEQKTDEPIVLTASNFGAVILENALASLDNASSTSKKQADN